MKLYFFLKTEIYTVFVHDDEYKIRPITHTDAVKHICTCTHIQARGRQTEWLKLTVPVLV